MKPFPYDEFYPVFMEEIKSTFSRFISHDKDKKPYIFAVSAANYIAENHSKSYCLRANGNTIVDFESPENSLLAELSSKHRSKIVDFKSNGDLAGDALANLFSRLKSKGVDFEPAGYSYANTDDIDGYSLCYKYSLEEWDNKAFTVNDFPKSNSIILDYVMENYKDMVTDKNCEFTKAFKNFRPDFFDYLIKYLKQLRDEKFFDSVYPEKMLINFEVREYYSGEDMVRIFEYLNTKEEAELYSQWLL